MTRSKHENGADLQRVSRLLALLLIKDLDEADAARLLHKAGFAYGDIGDLMGVSAEAVRKRFQRKRKAAAERGAGRRRPARAR